jgi:hypothetical protein
MLHQILEPCVGTVVQTIFEMLTGVRKPALVCRIDLGSHPDHQPTGKESFLKRHDNFGSIGVRTGVPNTY